MLNTDTDNDLLYGLLHLSCKSKIAGRFYTCSASSDCCPCCYGHHINRKHTCDTTVSEALSLPLSVSLSIFLLVSLSVCRSFSFSVSVSVSLCLCFSLPRVSFLVLHTFFLSLTLSLSVSWSITLIHNRNVFLSFLGAQFHAKYLQLSVSLFHSACSLPESVSPCHTYVCIKQWVKFNIHASYNSSTMCDFALCCKLLKL